MAFHATSARDRRRRADRGRGPVAATTGNHVAADGQGRRRTQLGCRGDPRNRAGALGPAAPRFRTNPRPVARLRVRSGLRSRGGVRPAACKGGAGSSNGFGGIMNPVTRLVASSFLCSIVASLAGCGGGGGAGASSPPAAPLGLVVEAGVRSLSLSWRPVDGASSYSVYVGTSPLVDETSYGFLPDGLHIPATPYNEARVYGLADGVTYYVRVSASNSAGAGALSGPVAATLAPGLVQGLRAFAGVGSLRLNGPPRREPPGTTSTSVGARRSRAPVGSWFPTARSSRTCSRRSTSSGSRTAPFTVSSSWPTAPRGRGRSRSP